MKFIDFFSGIGGFRLGMEMAGHECVGHCEIDKYADKSYRAMHQVKENEWYANDITRVEPRDLPNAECYCGGFPCQAFSIAGKRGGFDDTRGTLFFEVMRLARVRRPEYLFLENVKGLLSSKTTLNYAVIHSILLTDLSTWRQIWEENQSSQNLKYNLSTVIINYYLQEILGIELENQNLKLDHILKTISGLVSERTAQSQELGRAKSYRSYLTEIKQFTKKLNCSHTERQAQLEEKLFEVDSHIDLLISTDSLIQTDMNTLESIIHTLDDAESMLRKCLEEHYKTEKLFTILMGENQMTEPTTYLYVLQELSILTSIILRCKSSENLLSEVQLDSIEQKENMNYVNTFGVIIGYLSELGYDAEWQVLNSKNFGVPQNRERVFIIGHLRNGSGREVFPIEETNRNIGTPIKRLAHSRYYRRILQTYDTSGSCEAIDTMQGGNRQPVFYCNGKYKKASPKECFRLQGFPDEYFERAKAVNSNSQLYKQAGNSVTVNVIYEIARRLE